MKAAWEQFIKEAEENINPVQFNDWFKPMKLKSVDNSHLILEAPNGFHKNYFKDNWRTFVLNRMETITSRKVELVLIAKGEEAPRSAPARIVALEPPSLVEPIFPPKPVTGRALNPQYVFENFVEGESNRIARSAAFMVAEAPGRCFNPLFIHGGVGIGKTHLLNAIGNRIRATDKRARVLLLSCEQFTNEMIAALQKNAMGAFRMRYRDSCDVLLIDDIHFLAGKKATQEEFFHTFDTLHSMGKQIVVTCDQPPTEIAHLSERLRSRFQWGVIALVEQPDFNTRLAILLKKAEQECISLPRDVANLLSTSVESHVRDLESALVTLKAYARIYNQEISLGMASEMIKKRFFKTRRAADPERIKKLVASYFNIKPIDLKSRLRKQSIVYPRQIAMFLCRKHTRRSLPQIGELFGGKHHSTVLKNISKIEQLLEADPAVAKTIKELEESLK